MNFDVGSVGRYGECCSVMVQFYLSSEYQVLKVGPRFVPSLLNLARSGLRYWAESLVRRDNSAVNL